MSVEGTRGREGDGGHDLVAVGEGGGGGGGWRRGNTTWWLWVSDCWGVEAGEASFQQVGIGRGGGGETRRGGCR